MASAYIEQREQVEAHLEQGRKNAAALAEVEAQEQQERYRALYIPQVPMHALTVEAKSLEHAAIALEAIIALSTFEFENKVKPDYSDVAIIERWDGEEWELIEDEEWEDLAEELGIVTGSTEP